MTALLLDVAPPPVGPEGNIVCAIIPALLILAPAVIALIKLKIRK